MIRKPYFLATVFCCVLAWVNCSEKEFRIVSGEAAFSYLEEGKTLEISYNGDVVIEWDALSIDEGEKIHFAQKSKNGVVLNRLMPNATGEIAGNIEADGKIHFDIEKNLHFAKTAHLLCKELEVFDTAEKSSHISQEGEIVARSGNIRLMAEEIDMSGTMQAALSRDVELTARSHLKVLGTVVVEKGTISLFGSDVLLADDAELNVSAQEGSGRIFIGKNPYVQIGNAGQVVIAKGAKIHADSLSSGDAGEVFIWSNDRTDFAGFLSAQALGRAGNGGNVEISGSNAYGFHGIVTLAASNGQRGSLLLDPQFIYIFAGGLDPATGNTFASDPSGSVFIDGAALGTALDSADVTLQANTDIFFSDIVSTTASSNLILQAGRSISFDYFSSLTLNGGTLTVSINDSGADPANRDAGSAQLMCSPFAQILTQGGNINMSVGTFGGVQIGELFFSSATLDAGGGNISFTGFGANDLMGIGIYVSDCTIQTSGIGTITMNGTGGSGNSYQNGISLNGLSGCFISTADGNIQVTGNGGPGTGIFNTGIMFSDVNMTASGAGSIILNGTGGTGTIYNVGVYITGFFSTTSVNMGTLSVTGNAHGSGNYNHGILYQGQTFAVTGPGSLNFTGASAPNANLSFGIFISSPNALITSSEGAMSFNGTGTSGTTNVQGIQLESAAQVTSTATGGGAGAITLTGISHGSGNTNNGISMIGTGTTINSIDGNIILTGTGSGTGPVKQGVRIQYPTNVFTTGTGIVTINSTP